jgi:UDP-N-acetylglucosamine--N-acetylmuramyl-(pentapeptide) pyrophosphoryl-undecaprenol N-acetylglucosamine transferase
VKSDRILLAGGGTGGHVFPMIAVADALRTLASDVESVFVGTERGMETRAVPARGYRLELVDVLPLRGGGAAGVLRGVLRAASSVPESIALLRQLAPAAVFSIGGYAAGPVSLAARALGLPLALMEPNAVIGLANRLIAPLVTRAYTAFPEVERQFAKRALLRSGVPIRAGFAARPYARRGKALAVLVLGGSQGAKALNEAVPQALAHARTPVRVVHQCGTVHEPDVRARYAELGAQALSEVVPFIEDMPSAIAAADLVISRAGASAVSEICAIGRPSLLVPYPFAAGNHQLANAQSLAQGGAAICVPSADATPERIASEIDRLAASAALLPRMAEAARRRGSPDAALVIARDLLALAGITTPSLAPERDRGGDGDGSVGFAARAAKDWRGPRAGSEGADNAV